MTSKNKGVKRNTQINFQKRRITPLFKNTVFKRQLYNEITDLHFPHFFEKQET